MGFMWKVHVVGAAIDTAIVAYCAKVRADLDRLHWSKWCIAVVGSCPHVAFSLRILTPITRHREPQLDSLKAPHLLFRAPLEVDVQVRQPLFVQVLISRMKLL